MENEIPDIRDSIAVAYAKETKNLQEIQKKMFSLKSDEDKVKLIVAAGHIPGENAFNSMYGLIEEGKIKKQDVSSYFTSFGAYRENRDLAVKEFSKMVSKLQDIFSGSGTASNLVFHSPYFGILQPFPLPLPHQCQQVFLVLFHRE